MFDFCTGSAVWCTALFELEVWDSHSSKQSVSSNQDLFQVKLHLKEKQVLEISFFGVRSVRVVIEIGSGFAVSTRVTQRLQIYTTEQYVNCTQIFNSHIYPAGKFKIKIEDNDHNGYHKYLCQSEVLQLSFPIQFPVLLMSKLRSRVFFFFCQTQVSSTLRGYYTRLGHFLSGERCLDTPPH